MTTQTKVRWLDHYVFQYCKKQLANASPDEICAFYVQHFIFKNGDYLKTITERYNLQSDFLKLHKQIEALSLAEYEKMGT